MAKYTASYRIADYAEIKVDIEAEDQESADDQAFDLMMDWVTSNCDWRADIAKEPAEAEA